MNNKFTQTSDNSKYSGVQKLVDFEIGLKNYNSHTAKLIFKNFSLNETRNQKSKILDFGAGIGTIAEILRDKYLLNIECVEIDHGLIKVLKGKNFNAFASLENLTHKYRLIYTSNVLEHIENDLEALVKLRSAISENGKLLIYVPAQPVLFSNFDYQVGHFRRYKKKQLIKTVSEAGFTVEKCVYNDSLGFFAALLYKIKNKVSQNSDISQRNLLIYDKCIYPISRILDSLGLKYITGKNLLLIAKTR